MSLGKGGSSAAVKSPLSPSLCLNNVVDPASQLACLSCSVAGVGVSPLYSPVPLRFILCCAPYHFLSCTCFGSAAVQHLCDGYGISWRPGYLEGESDDNKGEGKRTHIEVTCRHKY